jgi:hypothetical protein
VLFDVIFLSLFLLGWLACAYVPWLALSIATRGQAGMILLPICLFTGVVGAMAVPVLGFDGAGGLKASFLVAFLSSGALLGIARFAHQLQPADEPAEASDVLRAEHPDRP